MELIYDILKKLRNYELRVVRNLFKTAPFEFEKVGKLFELVIRFTEKDENFYSQLLYEKDVDNVFRVTKSRLKKAMEDAVLSEKSLGDYSADNINALLKARKRLLQGEILLGRGAYKAGKSLLLKVIGPARKYSFHRELFQAQMLLHRAQSINSSVKEFEKSTEELLSLNLTESLVNEAGLLYYALSNFLTNETTEDEVVMAGLEDKLNRIEAIHNQVNSPHSAYYYLYSNVLYNQYLLEYDEAKRFCLRYVDLLQTEPALHSKQKLANAHFQLAEISMRMGDSIEAQKFIDETLSFYKPEETNYLITLGTAFRIAYHSKNWARAT